MRTCCKLLLLLTLVGLDRPGARMIAETAAVKQAEQVAAKDTTAYTLPPEKMKKARDLTRIWNVYAPTDSIWSLVQLVLILALGVAAGMRDAVARTFKAKWLQRYAFVFLFVLLTALLSLPLDIFHQHLRLVYGFSVQGWGSWLGDQGKSLAITVIFGGLLTLALFGVMRRSPQRWWLWFWMVAVAFVFAGVFVMPYVIDPLFNKFEPLTKSNPALVQQLEQVVARGGLEIPPERMFLMKASDKVTTLNAYVTGFGVSKRVVVWDTTIAKATPDEISFIFGHEMGHYALGHVVLGVAFSCGMLLLFFWLGFHAMHWLLRRYGAAWRIASQDDLAALVVLVLVVSVVSTLADPIMHGFGRAVEHKADIYGQEAVHGILADPRKTGQAAFQVLGEESLDDPTPEPLIEWWTYSHPPIRTRAAFAKAYDPWAAGAEPKYFPK